MRSARRSWPPAAPAATAGWSSPVSLCLGGWRVAEVTMPRLSDTMTEGTIAKWLKQPGDEVKKGDILLEIETDKATMELEAYEAQTVPIGQPIMLIGDGSGASSSGQEAAPAAEDSGDVPKADASESGGEG